MSDAERDTFLLEVRLGNLAVGRVGKGPLLAPIWYSYEPGGPIEMCTGAASAKAHRLSAEGRATLSVVDPGSSGRYRYVAVEGPVTLRDLGAGTRDAILRMSTRYLGPAGGGRYTDRFMRDLSDEDLMVGHGTSEVLVALHPQRWRTEVLG